MRRDSPLSYELDGVVVDQVQTVKDHARHSISQVVMLVFQSLQATEKG